MPIETLEAVNTNPHLTPEDQAWLTSFGVDPTWQDNDDLRNELDALVDLGSVDLHGYSGDSNAVIEAREKFLTFVGVKDETIDTIRQTNPFLMRLETFIGSQRALAKAGINGAYVVEVAPPVIGLTADNVTEKIENLRALNIDPIRSISLNPTILRQSTENIRENVAALQEAGLDVEKTTSRFPAVICYAPESIRAKLANLNDLGINPIKAINAHAAILAAAPDIVRSRVEYLNSLGIYAQKVFNKQPTSLTYPSETLANKIENLQQLGLNPVKIINLNPSVLGNSPENIGEKFSNLKNLGLNAARVLNTHPASLSLGTDSVQRKFQFLRELGLNPVTVINNQPAVLGYSEDSIAAKMKLLERTVKLLKWDFTAQDLVNRIPKMLGTSAQKISIQRRIAAEYGLPRDRTMTPDEMLYPMITPLEKVIIELAEDLQNKPRSIDEINRRANSRKLTVSERQERALEIARSGVLGRIGIMYLKYRGEDS